MAGGHSLCMGSLGKKPGFGSPLGEVSGGNIGVGRGTRLQWLHLDKMLAPGAGIARLGVAAPSVLTLSASRIQCVGAVAKLSEELITGHPASPSQD